MSLVLVEIFVTFQQTDSRKKTINPLKAGFRNCVCILKISPSLNFFILQCLIQTFEDGDMALLDMGAEYHFYGSDITCSFPVSILSYLLLEYCFFAHRAEYMHSMIILEYRTVLFFAYTMSEINICLYG